MAPALMGLPVACKAITLDKSGVCVCSIERGSFVLGFERERNRDFERRYINIKILHSKMVFSEVTFSSLDLDRTTRNCIMPDYFES